MTGVEVQPPLPAANSAPSGLQAPQAVRSVSPSGVRWHKARVPPLEHQVTPEQAAAIKANSFQVVEQAGSRPPQPQPTAEAAGPKRAHDPNAAHPQRRLSIPEREALHMAYCIAAYQQGKTVPVCEPEPVLDKEVLAQALTIVRSQSLVEGVPAARKPEGSWLHKRQARTLAYWVRHKIAYGHVNDLYSSAERARKFQFSLPELEQARDEICAARATSWSQAAAQPAVKALMAERGCSWAYLKAALVEFDPKLGLHIVAFKKALSDDTRQERVTYSRKRLAEPADKLRRYVFIDQKKLFVNAVQGAHKVISSSNSVVTQPEVVTCKPPVNNSKAGVIYAYLAVNAVLGPVHLYIGTGTHLRGESLKGYKVGPIKSARL